MKIQDGNQLQAQVEYTDSICGCSVYVLIDPLIEQVTHLVVKEDLSPNTEYIVPVDIFSATIAATIRLNCNKAELEQIKPSYTGFYYFTKFIKNISRARGVEFSAFLEVPCLKIKM